MICKSVWFNNEDADVKAMWDKGKAMWVRLVTVGYKPNLGQYYI